MVRPQPRTFASVPKYRYDKELVDQIQINDAPTLYIIHLMGLHYDYDNRYPADFKRFNGSRYKNYTDKQAENLAAYDNACLYNDYVLNQIVQKFRQTDACIVYLSDHGEEIYDIDGYAGHGNAHIRDPKYQVRIPMFMFPTERFCDEEPKKVERMKAAIDVPIAQDDFCHLLMDLAGIRNNWYSACRSALNPEYVRKHRIILNSIDFDAESDGKISDN